MKTLVTGADSFMGSWLSDALVAAGDEVIGISRRRNIDITDANAVAKVVADNKPERVFHLAAQSNIPRSFKDPKETFVTNVIGSTNLFEAMREHAPSATIVSIGSSSEYGDTARTIEFLDEDSPLLPTSPYAISKVAQGSLAKFYAHAHGMRVIHVRPFAIIGPRKEADALSDFSRTIALIELDRAKELTVGNTSALRDFVDVRDFVSAARIIGERGEPGATYNVCNDRATSLADILAILVSVAKRKIEVRTDPAKFRPIDDQRIVGSSKRARALGWAPKFSLDETVSTTLEFWRARV